MIVDDGVSFDLLLWISLDIKVGQAYFRTGSSTEFVATQPGALRCGFVLSAVACWVLTLIIIKTFGGSLAPVAFQHAWLLDV